jgi:hypothetical protein
MKSLDSNEMKEIFDYGIPRKKKKAIISHLDQKLSLLQKNINSKKYKISQRAYFAGGCIRDLINDETPSDYDLFLKELTSIEDIEKLFCKTLIVCKTQNALTLNIKGFKFQIIVIRSGHPVKNVNGFDFNVNKNFYIPSDSDPMSNFYVAEYISIIHKHLSVSRGVHNPIDALYRLNKFGEKGFHISRVDFVELIKQIGDMSTRGRYIEDWVGEGYRLDLPETIEA